MPWIKVDDHFDEHPKFAKAGPLGIAMWLAGLAYCNRNLTDGFVPWGIARSLLAWEFLKPHPEDASREMIWTVDVGRGMHGEQVTCEFVIELLVDAGLWEDVPGGYRVHDFDDYQPSKAEVLAEREKVRGRVTKCRNARRNAVTNGGVTGAPVPVPVPVPQKDSKNVSLRAREGSSLEPVAAIMPRVVPK
jgi:hypothetical protein